ncbi:hypothetical protein MKW94_010555, partial [Papaver nudicaule]|nr:hypothetical protein [Papaver nudicaule]
MFLESHHVFNMVVLRTEIILLSLNESVECQRRVQKRGGKPPQTAPTNPMFHLQSDHLQIHSNGKKTGERLPTPPTIQSPENERRVVRRNHTSLPNSSPLDDNLLNTPTRRSPRLHRSSIQRNREPEYEDPHSPPRTHGHRPVQPAVDNEIHHHLVQVRDSRTSASRRLSNQSQSNGLRRSASQPSQRSQQNALRNSASQLTLGSRRQNSHGIDSTPEISNRSRLASNSPVPNNEEVCAANNPEQEGQPLHKKRGPTTNLAVGKRGKNKVEVDIFEKDICGVFRAECVNSIGSWVRQRDNCPLQYDTFDELPERNVDRVIQNVRVMRAAYTRHRYQIHLEYLELVEKLGSHEAALAQPPSYCSNKHDWTHMCGYFKSPAFK